MKTFEKVVIIADDDDDDIDLFITTIKECSEFCRILAVNNGVELLQMLKKIGKPDLIVLDINMPFMSGLECLKCLKRDFNFKDLNIIIMSTAPPDLAAKDALSNGATDYITKAADFATYRNDICKLYEKYLR